MIIILCYLFLLNSNACKSYVNNFHVMFVYVYEYIYKLAAIPSFAVRKFLSVVVINLLITSRFFWGWGFSHKHIICFEYPMLTYFETCGHSKKYIENIIGIFW